MNNIKKLFYNLKTLYVKYFSFLTLIKHIYKKTSFINKDSINLNNYEINIFPIQNTNKPFQTKIYKISEISSVAFSFIVVVLYVNTLIKLALFPFLININPVMKISSCVLFLSITYVLIKSCKTVMIKTKTERLNNSISKLSEQLDQIIYDQLRRSIFILHNNYV